MADVDIPTEKNELPSFVIPAVIVVVAIAGVATLIVFVKKKANSKTPTDNSDNEGGDTE